MINVGDKLTIVLTTNVEVTNVHTYDNGSFSIDTDDLREFHFPDKNGNNAQIFRDGDEIWPPPIPEPTELGAVVVDAFGTKYFRVYDNHTPWVSTGTAYYSWNELESPVVL